MRSNAASQAIGSVVASTDAHCKTAADCVLEPVGTACTDSCGDALVAHSAVSEIRAAVERVNQRECAGFAADGCQVIAQPCVPPPAGVIECIDGQCQQQLSPPPLDCKLCFDRELRWGRTNHLVTHTLRGCNDFLSATETETLCAGQVQQCATEDTQFTIHGLLSALDEPDVKEAFARGGTVGGPPGPDGQAVEVSLDGASFVISDCFSSGCTPLSSGIASLRWMLQGGPDMIACTRRTAIQACPPNTRFVEAACTACGTGGGCVRTESRCAKLCDQRSDCGEASGEVMCSPRKLCEVGFCI